MNVKINTEMDVGNNSYTLLNFIINCTVVELPIFPLHNIYLRENNSERCNLFSTLIKTLIFQYLNYLDHSSNLIVLFEKVTFRQRMYNNETNK